MVESRRILLIFLFQLFPGVSAINAFSQEGVLKSYEYLSPTPFSVDHNPETAIIIRFGEKINVFSLRNDLFEVTGAISGKHKGKFTIGNDYRTLIFTPDQIFSYNEKVALLLGKGIQTQSGRFLPGFSYWFKIRQEADSDLYTVPPDENRRPVRLTEKYFFRESAKGIPLSFLDFKFPEITLSNQPAKGNILTTLVKNSTDYLYVFDNKANPVFARVMPHPISNLKTSSFRRDNILR